MTPSLQRLSALALAAVLAGCVSAPQRTRTVQAPPPAAAGPKMIMAEAGGTYVLPDGTRVLRDGAGGFMLPNGAYVSRLPSGDLQLPTGSVCRASGPNFVCP